MDQIHMLYISITNRFENKTYGAFRGDITIEQFIIRLIEIQEKYKVD